MTFRKSLTSALACVAAIASSALVSGDTHASDAKVHHGSMCAPYSMAAGTFRNSYDGTVNDGSAAWLQCAGVRDNTGAITGTISAKIRGYTPGTSGFTCTFRAFDKDNYWSYSNSVTMPTAAGRYDKSVSVSQAYAGGSYALQCWMPTGASIMNYLIDEP